MERADTRFCTGGDESDPMSLNDAQIDQALQQLTLAKMARQRAALAVAAAAAKNTPPSPPKPNQREHQDPSSSSSNGQQQQQREQQPDGNAINNDFSDGNSFYSADALSAATSAIRPTGVASMDNGSFMFESAMMLGSQQVANNRNNESQPVRVLLIRHGEAQSNVDKTIYKSMPDHCIPLTEAGKKMARIAGKKIDKFLTETFGDSVSCQHHIRMMVSPFLRTRQTAELVLEGMREAQLERIKAAKKAKAERNLLLRTASTSATASTMPSPQTSASGAATASSYASYAANLNQQLSFNTEMSLAGAVRADVPSHDPDNSNNDCNMRKFWVDSIRESSMLVEQDFGSLEGTGQLAQEKYREEVQRMKMQKDFQGQYYARCVNGESFQSVCERVAPLVSDIIAAAKSSSVTSKRKMPVRTVIIVSHGVTIRAFCSQWLSQSPETLATTSNPPNCSIRLLQGSSDAGYIFGGYGLHGAAAEELEKYGEDGLDVNKIRCGVDEAKSNWLKILNRIHCTKPSSSEEEDDDNDGNGDDSNNDVEEETDSEMKKAHGSWLCDATFGKW